jgi:SRSO17 transposase
LPISLLVFCASVRSTSLIGRLRCINWPDATLKTPAAAIKARWLCGQAHQQLREEYGLDHFEGRSWTGLYRHCLMAMIAFALLQSRRLTAAGRK